MATKIILTICGQSHAYTIESSDHASALQEIANIASGNGLAMRCDMVSFDDRIQTYGDDGKPERQRATF